MPGAGDSFVKDALPPASLQPEFLFELPEHAYPERLNAASELVDRAVAEGDGERVAIRNALSETSYAELADRSGRVARLLVEQQRVVPGNRVLLLGPNSAMLFTAWLGILKAGGVAVTLMPQLRAFEIASVLGKAEVSHAIVDSRFRREFDAAAQDSGRPLPILTFTGDTENGDLERGIELLTPLPALETGRDDPAIIAFTSGTTGSPKGCIQFHRDILAPADGYARKLLNLNRDDVVLCSAPIAFTFGLGAQLIFPLRARATSLTLEEGSPAALLQAIENYGVTALFTAPTAYKKMLVTLERAQLASLRLCVSAGEHLSAATWQGWRDATGLDLIDGIGATEMMHVFISSAPDEIRPGATGRIVAGYRGCVLDAAGFPRSEGTGRLAVKGPTGCRYLADPRQAAYVHDGWNVTGDTYRLDGDGYYWYIGRSDDMIISSGHNISPTEVEDVLLTHPAVLECAVIGAPCPQRNAIVKAFVVSSGATDQALAMALKEYVRSTIAPYKSPREIVFVESLPKTATGKIKRHLLNDHHDGVSIQN
jgi:2-aminobenzoate-CoA ligase